MPWIEGEIEKSIYESIRKLRTMGAMPETAYMNKATYVSLLYESHNVVASIERGKGVEHYIFGLKMEERNDLEDNKIVIQ